MHSILLSSHLENPVVILAILISSCFILYKIYKAIKFLSSLFSQKSKTSTKKDELNINEKKQAIDNFKKIHAKARDNKTKIQKEIAKNPKKTTEVFRKMMKR